MKGVKIIGIICLLFLLGVAIYFFAIDGYAEANISISRGINKGDRINGYGVIFLFCCVAWGYIYVLREDRKIKRRTKFKK